MPAPRLIVNDRERGTTESLTFPAARDRIGRNGGGRFPRTRGNRRTSLISRFLPQPDSNTPRRGGAVIRRPRRG